jgi:arginyl-tRNA synthetase
MMDILDRIKHFEIAQRENGDKYGAEVLYHAYREIERLRLIEMHVRAFIQDPTRLQVLIDRFYVEDESFNNTTEDEDVVR